MNGLACGGTRKDKYAALSTGFKVSTHMITIIIHYYSRNCLHWSLYRTDTSQINSLHWPQLALKWYIITAVYARTYGTLQKKVNVLRATDGYGSG